jgi:hypothetical protein
MIYIKRHKNYIYKQKKKKKKKRYRWRLTHLPSLLTRTHWYGWISRKIDHDPSETTFNLLPESKTPFLMQTWEESTNLFIDG